MDYYALINRYLDEENKSSMGDRTREYYRRAFIRAVDFLILKGYQEPNEEFFKAITEDETLIPNKRLIPKIRKFFAWTKQEQEGENMTNISTDTTETMTAQTEQAMPEQAMQDVDTAQETPIIPADFEPDASTYAEDTIHDTPKRRGRKMFGDEPRTVKISIYITPTLFADAQDLARIDATSFPDYVFSAIQRDADNRRDKINTLRALRG